MYVCTRIESDLAIAVRVTTQTYLALPKKLTHWCCLLLHVTGAVYAPVQVNLSNATKLKACSTLNNPMYLTESAAACHACIYQKLNLTAAVHAAMLALTACLSLWFVSEHHYEVEQIVIGSLLTS